MNILLVTMEMNIGGAETHVLELAKSLKTHGSNVIVVSAGGKLVNELEENGIKHIYAPLKDKKVNHIITSAKTIKNIIQEEKIDVVHAHARIPGAVCGYVCKKTKTHFVTTIHGIYRTSMLLKMLTNWGERTLAVSEDIKKHAIDEYKLNPENVFVTVNGIDLDKFKKEQQTSLEGITVVKEKVKIIHVSRLDKESTSVAEALIDVSDELDKEIKNGVQVIIVGAGNNYEYLKSKAKDNPNVILTGGRTDVNKLLNISDIFVGVSRAALEAMASELPIILAGNIAYKQGYIGILNEKTLDTAVKTNFTCREMEELDKSRLKKDIIELLNANTENMGKYNREIVSKFYSVERMTQDALKLYKF